MFSNKKNYFLTCLSKTRSTVSQLKLVIQNFDDMKKLKLFHILILLLGIFMLQDCQTKKNNWELEGNAPDTAGMVYLYQLNSLMKKEPVDSVLVNNGKFTIEHTNEDGMLAGYVFSFNENDKDGIEFIISNGDQLNVEVKDEFNSVFSGTPTAKEFNEYNHFRFTALTQLSNLQKLLAQNEMTEEELNDKMLVFKEEMQELENEKIEFLKNIQNPELNSFLILNEIISTGVIEKELFEKYVNALTPEGAMTNNGHKIHQIYDVIDAFALSQEIDILDTATIRERYNKLDEVNKHSEFAEEVREYLNKM